MPETQFNPLYSQVRETLITMIADGIWAPGQKLPSEFSLADDLGVSQGTVRKALNALARENIVMRQQGRGTFVPEQTERWASSHFLRLRLPDGAPAVPRLVSQKVSKQTSTPTLLQDFGCSEPDELWLVERILRVEPNIGILERIFVRADLIANLAQTKPLPNELYEHYQSHYGITITAVEDTLRSILARRFHARRIDVTIGTPLLELHRVSSDLRGRVIEMRWLHCTTDNLNYATSLI